jgi:gliding motility-associated-like protein
MKKHLLLQLLTFILLSNALHAQFQNGLWTGKQANNWYFYNNAGLNFDTSPPTPLTDGELISGSGYDEGCGSISDEEGNLLFYTNGVTVWNKNHVVMLNGEGLIGDISSTQTGLIVPKPGSHNIYYIFSANGAGASDPTLLAYSEVDMSLDEGLGAITENKNIVIAAPAGEKISAVHHADGEQVWVVCHTGAADGPSNTFKAFRISEAGVNSAPVISSVGEIISVSFGQMKISPDATKIGIINGYMDTNIVLQVFSFDNATGIVTSPVTLTSAIYDSFLEFVYGLEFSPDSRFLYTTEPSFVGTGRLHQFDLSAGDGAAIMNSDTILADGVGEGYFFESLQLGPDGKIYLTAPKYLGEPIVATTMGVINYPNNKGIAAGLARGTVDIAGKMSGLGLPGFIQSYFESGILYEGGQCARDEVAFSTIRIPGIERIIWNFGDIASGAANTSTDLEPTHAFTAAGTYTVTATITSNGVEQTATTQVIITAADAVVPVIPAICADNSGNAVFNLTQLNAAILNGQDAAVFAVAYFASETDVNSNRPIATPEGFTTSGQTIYARVTNTNRGCTTTISFNLVVNPLPIASVPNALEICNNAASANFNLISQTAAIRNAQNPDIFTVSYYANPADAQANTAIANPAAFTSTGQTVYAMVVNTATGCTSNLIEFDLTVKQPVIVTDVIGTEGCIPFNLTTLAPSQSAGLILSYYTAEQDAISAANAIVQFEAYRFEGQQQTVYIREEDPQGCASIYTLQLQVGNCEIPRGISPNNDGKNDSFDLSGFDVKQLSIYNRYGQQVYSRNNYQSEWHGQADNNNELPTGTYYYSIEQGGGEQKTGWVYINREVN